MSGIVQYAFGSQERVRVELMSKTRTGAELVTAPVSLAVKPIGVDPVELDWVAGSWEPLPGARRAVARALFTHNVRGRFVVHARLAIDPELILKRVGLIEVT